MIEWLMKLWKKKQPKPEPVDLFPDEILPADIKWLGVNVGAWKKTYGLEVEYNATQIIHKTDAHRQWPAKENISANCWIIANINGQWYAATHEFMRPNTNWRGKNTLDEDHIERREFIGWRPKNGEKVGHVVSGVVRNPNLKNVQERTNIVLKEWR